MSGERALRLLREVHGGLADVNVCNLHMLRPTSETQNCETNKYGAQNGGFDAFEGMQCLIFFATAYASWRIRQCESVTFGGFGGFNLGPTLGFQGGWVPQTKPIPLLVPLDHSTTGGSLSKEA